MTKPILVIVNCCHTTGMHDPEHKYVCNYQKAEAFDKLLAEGKIKAVVEAKDNCYWCLGEPVKRKEHVKEEKERRDLQTKELAEVIKQ